MNGLSFYFISLVPWQSSRLLLTSNCVELSYSSKLDLTILLFYFFKPDSIATYHDQILEWSSGSDG